VSFTDVQGTEVHDGRFFADGAGIGEHNFRVFLQMVVVVETKGFQKLDEGVELFVVRCLLFVVRCSLYVVRCSLFGV